MAKESPSIAPLAVSGSDSGEEEEEEERKVEEKEEGRRLRKATARLLVGLLHQFTPTRTPTCLDLVALCVLIQGDNIQYIQACIHTVA